jgi:salicylate hydroxylase
VLVDYLSGGTPLSAALRRYDEIRRPRTAEVHRQARLRAQTFHLPDGPAQRARDARLAAEQTLAHLDWLYGPDPVLTLVA